jgi:hypothetical protein
MAQRRADSAVRCSRLVACRDKSPLIGGAQGQEALPVAMRFPS